MVKIRGHEELQQRPLDKACNQCFTWFQQFIAPLFTWEDFTMKFSEDMDFKLAIEISEKLSVSPGKADFSQYQVDGFRKYTGEIVRSRILLSERELMNALRVSYIPRQFLCGPSIHVCKEHGVGLEKVFIFQNPNRPWREQEDRIIEGESARTMVMRSTEHIWPSKHEEMLAFLRQAREKTSGALDVLVDRVAPLPDLQEWMEKVLGKEDGDDADAGAEYIASSPDRKALVPMDVSMQQRVEQVCDGVATNQWPSMAKRSAAATPMASKKRKRYTSKTPDANCASPTRSSTGMTSSPGILADDSVSVAPLAAKGGATNTQ